MFVSERQKVYAESEIVVTLFGILISVKFIQYANAYISIVVTVFGIVILVMLCIKVIVPAFKSSISAPRNAISPIAVTGFPS